MYRAVFLILILAAASHAADLQFSPRRTNDYDERANDGYCRVRVWVDDEVNVFVQGNRVTLETVRGQPARDAGTECNQPMPRGASLTGFQLSEPRGRGRIELVEEPAPRNRDRAWIRIRDQRGGGQEHSFLLTWRNFWTNQQAPPRSILGRRGRAQDTGFNGVCFYENTGFGGKEFCSPAGQHVANVGPEWNDKFRSMRLFGRAREVEMFDDQNWGGGSYRSTRDLSDLGDVRDSRGQRLDRRITSFRVY